ncbi:MAG: 2-amino-4-hydroxy-6-hydroxymethyldihydropteridine diphosphokinase, partial [Dehalococcoidia bacterium]
MTVVLIALGSNLGDRWGNLRAALRFMEEAGVKVLERSSAWETAPVPADQPRFLNAVVSAETALEAGDLLAALKGIEHALGRRPGRRWGPRPADLDLLFYGEERIATPDLEVPHPRIGERAFVLVPLSEVWRGPLPVLGATAL